MNKGLLTCENHLNHVEGCIEMEQTEKAKPKYLSFPQLIVCFDVEVVYVHFALNQIAIHFQSSAAGDSKTDGTHRFCIPG